MTTQTQTTTVPTLILDPVAKDLVFDAHTTQTFDPTPLPEDTVETIYDLIQYAPTAFNLQSLRLFPVHGAAKDTLVSHLMDGNKAKTETAPLTVIIAADTNFHDDLPHVYPIFPGARDFFLDDAAREQVAVQQAWLQFGYFILGARSLGLGVGPMTGADFAGITENLLPAGYKAIAVVNLGLPGENPHYPRNPRHDEAKVVTHLS